MLEVGGWKLAVPKLFKSIMKGEIILLIVAACIISGCRGNGTKCCEHVDTYKLPNGLYVERYLTFCGGVFGELTECYVTDSAKFRQKIGSYNQHESLYTKLDSDRIIAYRSQSLLISDTIEKKTILKADFRKYNQSDTNCVKTAPVFGTNTIKCDNSYPASSYKVDDGYSITQIQYKCGNDYTNAVLYKEPGNFCIFIGVYKPGSLENNYSVKRNRAGDLDFYNITTWRKTDTTNIETFTLTDLKKGKLIGVCK